MTLSGTDILTGPAAMPQAPVTPSIKIISKLVKLQNSFAASFVYTNNRMK